MLLGVNSVALAVIAARRTDGINVAWDHPARDELLQGALAARGTRDDFLLTTWTHWDEGLLDEDHPARRAMADRNMDRLVLLVPSAIDADRIAAAPIS